MRKDLILKPTHILDVQSTHPKHFIVVGAGGNGGYLIPALARQMSIQNKHRAVLSQPLHKLTIIDADEVEDKNLVRQNFVSRDIGKNKAEVMATRYGNAFGIDISYMEEYLEKPSDLEAVHSDKSYKPVIIGCVDNNKTRVIMNDFHKSVSSFYLDAGNEEWAGQVVAGHNTESMSHFGAGLMDDDEVQGPYIFDLPSIVDVHPEVANGEDKLPTEMSCAENAVSHPQNIMTNQTAANLLMTMCNTLLTANILNGDGLDVHAVYFNAKTPSFTTTFNKAELISENFAKSEAIQQ